MYGGFFGDVLICGLRREGRRDWEIDLRYGVKKNYMITLESIDFFFTYFTPLLIHLAKPYIDNSIYNFI